MRKTKEQCADCLDLTWVGKTLPQKRMCKCSQISRQQVPAEKEAGKNRRWLIIVELPLALGFSMASKLRSRRARPSSLVLVPRVSHAAERGDEQHARIYRKGRPNTHITHLEQGRVGERSSAVVRGLERLRLNSPSLTISTTFFNTLRKSPGQEREGGKREGREEDRAGRGRPLTL